MIGIVASRLVERFHRPVVLIAGSQDGWKGSGRSVSRFDLHGALAACSEHLERFGGHRAAAGLSIEEASIAAFADAFAAHADANLTEEDLFPVTVIDAVVSAEELTLPLAQELDRLAPFGLGNPDVTLLVPGSEPVSPSTVGEGKHLRFRVRQNGRDAGSAIAFGQGSQLDRLRAAGLFDVACRLKENRWNGTIAPQLVVQQALRDSRELRGAPGASRRPVARGRRLVDSRCTYRLRRAGPHARRRRQDSPAAARRIGDLPRAAHTRGHRPARSCVKHLAERKRVRRAWRRRAAARAVGEASVESRA